MSITKIVATFTFVVTLTVAFASSNELLAQSSSRSVGDAVSAVAGSSSRSVPSVVTDFGGGAQQSFGGATESFGTQQTYVAPQVEYSGAPMETQYSSAPMVSSGPAYSPAASSSCGCSAAPAPAPMAPSYSYAAPTPAPMAPSYSYSAPAPQPIASPCGGGGCGGGCGSACGGGNWPTLRPGPATGRKVFNGGMFQRGRPCGCN